MKAHDSFTRQLNGMRESEWTFPPENDCWCGAYNSIRAELIKFDLALTAIVERDGNALDDWRLESVKAYVAGHAEHVHGHGQNEEDLFWPWLRTKFEFKEEGVGNQHEDLVEKLRAIEEMVKAHRVGDGVDGVLAEWRGVPCARRAAPDLGGAQCSSPDA